MVLKSEGCESRANIGNIARVSQMSHECRKLRGASDELGSDMGDCLQLILTQYEPNGNCVPTPVITMYASTPMITGRRPLQQLMDCLNPMSCFLVSATLQPPSRPI